ncbi:PIN/TRAM domain-containing protein [Mahella australiensis]|uniref:PilT protein domain protein n=1 Tax=Mahella australiensis (strain DSM 15567 / CIP 107919 / 50-1 BON) TaxID=697281 RepID=F4A2N9_MAHA5|nr:PIN/TRAM domain-containing protein [Mahella australiensis]AEE96219.1 PilT protein domain protein [Mahella australiensis 50-1 BON]
MLITVLRIVFGIIGAIIGAGISLLISDSLTFSLSLWQSIALYAVCSIAGGIISFLLSNKFIHWMSSLTNWMERELQKVPLVDVLLGVVGLIISSVVAGLLIKPIMLIPVKWFATALVILIYVLLCYIGVTLAVKRKDDIIGLANMFKKNTSKDKQGASNAGNVMPKILDTSVIIDGRIFDICRTGFVEGPLIIPTFVLKELRHIADSSDALKRNRGRRGLDILNRIQKELDIDVQIVDVDFEDADEVDIKLLRLCKLYNGKVITNDYNLNKVADFQGIQVLNINELANAVKPMVLPGEEMLVQVVKDGKESGQGVAYLDDGTMIVVDGGKKHVGHTIGVMVTSVLQTAAGRMIFAKPKQMDKAG